MTKEALTTPTELLEGLPEFEGLPTLEVSLEVRGIDGGLNEGLTISPVVMHKGDDVYLLVKGTVDSISHKPVKDRDGWRRVHVIRETSGTVVDAGFASDRLEEHARRIEQAKGLQRLPLEDELRAAHKAGEHADGLVDECPDCAEERELEAVGQ